MTWLERKFPRQWGRSDRHEIAAQVEGPVAGAGAQAFVDDPEIRRLGHELLRRHAAHREKQLKDQARDN